MSFVLLLLLGCAAHNLEHPSLPMYRCTWLSTAPLPLPPAPAGLLELELAASLAGSPPDPNLAPDAFEEEAQARRYYGSIPVHAVLVDAPIETVAQRLGELLEIPVGVDPRLRGIRLTASVQEGSLEDLITLLRESSQVYVSLTHGVLVLETPASRFRRVFPSELGELQQGVVPIEHADPFQVAQACCAAVLSPYGDVSVVDRNLVIRDYKGNVLVARELIKELEERHAPEEEGQDPP